MDLDHNNPVIQLHEQLNNTALIGGTVINLDVYDTTSSIVDILFNWDGNSNQTWTTSNLPTTSVIEGSYTLSVYASDNGNNWGASKFTFTTDNTIPSIALQSPSEGSIKKSSTQINYNISDVHLDTVFYRWDLDSNQTWDTPYQTTLPVGDGLHTLYVYANDSAGNWASDAYTFMADDTSALINLETPEEGSVIKSGFTIDANITDTNLDKVLYHWDGNNNDFWTFPYQTQLPPVDGVHILYVYVNDSAGNWANKTFSFIADDNIPEIELTNLITGSILQSGTSIQLNISDENSIIQVIYNWDGEDNSTLSSPYSVQQPEGDTGHTLSMFAEDIAGNWAKEVFTFDTDDTPPQISFLDPEQKFILKPDTPILLVFEDLKGVSLIEFKWDDALINQTLTNSSDIKLPIGKGNHTLVVYCYDIVGNIASKIYEFISDPDTPVIQPLSELGEVSGIITLTAIVEDDYGLDKIEFWIDGNLVDTIGNPKSGSNNLEYDTTSLADGQHELIVKAYDKAGNVKESETVNFNVLNNPSKNQGTEIPPAAIAGAIGLVVISLSGLSLRFIRGRRFDSALDDLEDTFELMEDSKEGKE